MHRASQNIIKREEFGVPMLSEWVKTYAFYHIFWILNVIEVLYLTMNTFTSSTPLYLIILFWFSTASMAASYLYAEYYHTNYGNNIFVKLVLVLFFLISFLIIIALNTAIIMSYTSYNIIKINRDDAIFNEILSMIPFIHSLILIYIWGLRWKWERGSKPRDETIDSFNPTHFKKQINEEPV